MGLFNKFKKKQNNKNVEFIKNAGGCIITKSLLNKESKLKWLFREQGRNAIDNGWRAFGDSDDEEYVNNPDNLLPVDFNTLANIEPAVLAIYNMKVGTELQYIEDNTGRYFIDTKTKEKIKLYQRSIE